MVRVCVRVRVRVAGAGESVGFLFEKLRCLIMKFVLYSTLSRVMPCSGEESTRDLVLSS